jgi:glycine hydroxymethyltransferase
MVSSGLRIGTPALATRGFGDEEFREVADVIATTLTSRFTDTLAGRLRDRVESLATKLPLYPYLDGEPA